MTDAGPAPHHEPAATPEPGSPTDAVWRPRALEELSAEERAAYERELDSGVTELPQNQVRGLLGEKAPSLYKIDEIEPDLNAGLSQEGDAPIKALLFLLAYVLFFPLAYVLLWRSRAYTRRSKIVVSVVMAIGVVVVAYALIRR